MTIRRLLAIAFLLFCQHLPAIAKAADLNLAQVSGLVPQIKLTPNPTGTTPLTIGLPIHPTPMESYAARELARYLHALTGETARIINTTSLPHNPGFLLGRPTDQPAIERLRQRQQLPITATNPGPQGYCLKRLHQNQIVIAANDEAGILYGVYGYLQEHLGIDFSFDGDILPARKTISQLFPGIDELKNPAVAIRGLLPWTNFPQSATSYSWQDWTFILDQMAKMRLNFLQIHNYSGEEGHNEMFHNFDVNGKLSRVWMATARSGHAWGSYPGWDVNKYCFGSTALFDDYDFGADCALHNETLDNRQVFRKGVNEFQRVIAYAHRRGIRIGLGLDINLIPDSYQLAPDDPRVIAARVKQIETDYPDLDYLLCFQSEGLSDPSAVNERRQWRTIFDGFYNGLKKTCPKLRLAVAGWGIRPEDVATLPPDVICAPISHYSDGCENGSAYGNREYWGCPWLERDFNSSVYYYPYNMDISNTIKAWQDRAPNMKGFYALTWRLTDAVKAKVEFMSRAPWDDKNQLNSSQALYQQFAEQQYGAAAAAMITAIINQNEPFASDFSECRWTPPFSLARVERGGHLAQDPVPAAQAQLDKAVDQLKTIDEAMTKTTDPGQRCRIGLLRSRIAAEQDHILLNMYAGSRTHDINDMTASWVSHFNHRVTDISSLGNVVSVQDRFIQKDYIDLAWKQLNTYNTLAPENVEARGTRQGTRISWKAGDSLYRGFDIYRDGKKITATPLPPDARQYEDQTSGLHRYEVYCLFWGNDSANGSVGVTALGGDADKTAPQIVVISPPGSVLAGQPVWIKARLLDNRADDLLTATLYYRRPGAPSWTPVPMARRVKSTFTTAIPASQVGPEGIEYYIAASDGDNDSAFPANAPAQPLSLVQEQAPAGATTATTDSARLVAGNKGVLQWQPVRSASYYDIYRSQQKDFTPGPDNLLTYLAADAALRFTDNGMDLRGQPLRGTWYYRVTAVDPLGYQSDHSHPVIVKY